MNRKIPNLYHFISVLFCLSLGLCRAQPGNTSITEWQYGKNGAVSITYDDASRHQFTRALPVMQKLKMPATFFVITGPITGSQFHGKFLGRPVEVIIEESATVPTDENNFFERCSAAGYLGYTGTISYHTRAGGLYSSGKKQQAFYLMDSLYAKVRNGDFPKGYEPCPEYKEAEGSTWDDFKKYTDEVVVKVPHSKLFMDAIRTHPVSQTLGLKEDFFKKFQEEVEKIIIRDGFFETAYTPVLYVCKKLNQI